MASAKKPTALESTVPVLERDDLTIRFAGDSGDGMQLAGAQFTNASAAFGNCVSTYLENPAEIRAPAGSLAGVTGFQVHFSKHAIHTPGDVLNALIAMNPAALNTHLPDLEPGGLLIVNADTFVGEELHQAGYARNPLEDGSLKGYRLFAVPINKRNREALSQLKLSPREVDRCKNFFALGLACWLFSRPLDPILQWIDEKFAKNPGAVEANNRSLRAGYHHAENSSGLPMRFHVAPAALPKGRYRRLTGTEALVLGLVTATQQAKLALVYAGAPSYPAVEILHQLAELKHHDLFALQAEDEIAAMNMALGASFGGAVGAVATNGPGMSLAAEGLGLGVMAELPCVIVNMQRVGPSTGLPTKTEQADLFQSLFGRHGECPLAVLAPASPADSFLMAYEAVRLAVRFMTPVVVLADMALAQTTEIWRVPAAASLPAIPVRRGVPKAGANGEPFLPFARDENQVRPWAIPGTPGLEHRVGGLEKEDKTGNVSYDPVNHETLVRLRAAKIANIANDIPLLEIQGPAEGDLLVVGWGSTYGAIASAAAAARKTGRQVASAHLRYLNPLPKNTEGVLRRYKKVLVPELNGGQLVWLLRARYLVDAASYNKLQGRPFLIHEIEAKIDELLS